MSVEVAGRMCLTSLDDHEHRCLAFIEQEQRSMAPDNFLIGVLCDSVRLARENADIMKWPLLPRTEMVALMERVRECQFEADRGRSSPDLTGVMGDCYRMFPQLVAIVAGTEDKKGKNQCFTK